MVGPYAARLLRGLALIMAAGILAGCRGHSTPTLIDLSRVDELKTQFNRDTGKPRVVLLLSPT